MLLKLVTGNGKRETGNGKRATGNGQRATGNGEWATGVWEGVYNGNPPETSTWRTKEKKREQFWANVRKCYSCKREFLPAVPPDHVPSTFFL